MIVFLKILAADFYARMRPSYSQATVLYMMGRAETFFIPGSY